MNFTLAWFPGYWLRFFWLHDRKGHQVTRKIRIYSHGIVPVGNMNVEMLQDFRIRRLPNVLGFGPYPWSTTDCFQKLTEWEKPRKSTVPVCEWTTAVYAGLECGGIIHRQWFTCVSAICVWWPEDAEKIQNLRPGQALCSCCGLIMNLVDEIYWRSISRGCTPHPLWKWHTSFYGYEYLYPALSQ